MPKKPKKRQTKPKLQSSGRADKPWLFQPGQSGNPLGRSRVPNPIYEAIRGTVTPEIAADIANRLTDAARKGSIKSAAFLLRAFPNGAFPILPGTKIDNAPDAGKAMAALASEMLAGKLSVAEAATAVGVVGAALAGLAGSSDLEGLLRRITELRAAVDAQKANGHAGPTLPWEESLHAQDPDPA
jgi:hypothetical protein